MSFEAFATEPLFGLTLTIAAYAAALLLQKKWSFLHPLLICSIAIIAVLMIWEIPYESYRKGADILVFLLGPATVALGIPLYKNAEKIKSKIIPIIAGITTGSISALLLSAAFVWMLGGSSELIATMMPKSATSPVALEISRQAGGIPELTAVLTVLTGLIGSIAGPALLRFAGVRDDISIGTAMGTAAHGIGTARIIQNSELAGSTSGFAMGISAILTSLLFIPIYSWFH